MNGAGGVSPLCASMNPDTASGPPEWQQIKAQFPVGARVRGTVTHHFPFGFFVDLGGARGLVQIVDFMDDVRVTVDLYPPVGSEIETVVLGHTDDLRRQVVLSTRPSRLRDAK